MNNMYLANKHEFMNNWVNGSISSKIAIALFSIMLYVLAFDFRSGEDLGKSIVTILGVISLLSGALLVISLNLINKKSLLIVLPATAFLLCAILSGISRGQQLYDVVSLSIPMFFFIAVVLCTSSIKIRPDKFRSFLHIVIAFAFLSVLFKLLFGFYYYGLTLGNARYQIISPAIILVFSYGVASMLYKQQRFGRAALLLSVLVAFVSVTRSYILVFAAVIFFWILCMPLSYWKKNAYLGVKLLLFMICLVVSVYAFLPDVFERWVIRLFTSIDDQGVDVTAITRIAEISYQVGKLLESPVNLLMGMGVAAETRFDPEYRQILSIVFREDFEYVGKGYGHNNYIGIIYTGGVIFGGLFIFSIFYGLMKLIMFFRSELIRRRHTTDYHFCFAWGGSAALAYSVYGVLGGTFGDRLAALSYGLSFGLVFFSKKFILKYT